jgi:DNA-binding response OmpR family regulator
MHSDKSAEDRKERILVIEGDVSLGASVVDFLEDEGFAAEAVATCEAARAKLRIMQYDMLIIDKELPDDGGAELLQELRSKGTEAPALLLTGHGSADDKAEAHGTDADDYLVKPFNMRELRPKINALFRRVTHGTPKILSARDIVLDIEQRTVTRAGAPLELGPKEFDLLYFFMSNPEKVFPTSAIVKRVWSDWPDANEQSFRMCLQRLKKKVDSDPSDPMIVNLHTAGYKLQPQPKLRST